MKPLEQAQSDERVELTCVSFAELSIKEDVYNASRGHTPSVAMIGMHINQLKEHAIALADARRRIKDWTKPGDMLLVGGAPSAASTPGLVKILDAHTAQAEERLAVTAQAGGDVQDMVDAIATVGPLDPDVLPETRKTRGGTSIYWWAKGREHVTVEPSPAGTPGGMSVCRIVESVEPLSLGQRTVLLNEDLHGLKDTEWVPAPTSALDIALKPAEFTVVLRIPKNTLGATTPGEAKAKIEGVLSDFTGGRFGSMRPLPLVVPCGLDGITDAPDPPEYKITFESKEPVVDLLREAINLAAVGDIDESTEAMGWGDWMRRAKALVGDPMADCNVADAKLVHPELLQMQADGEILSGCAERVEVGQWPDGKPVMTAAASEVLSGCAVRAEIQRERAPDFDPRVVATNVAWQPVKGAVRGPLLSETVFSANPDDPTYPSIARVATETYDGEKWVAVEGEGGATAGPS